MPKRTAKTRPKKPVQKPKSKAAKSTATAPAKKSAKAEVKLRQPQVRILAALARKHGLTRAEISERASVDLASLVEYVGAVAAEKRLANDKKHFPSLLSLGYVVGLSLEGEPVAAIRYSLLPPGRAALAAARKAAR